MTGTAAETWAWITATGPVSTGETPGAAEGLAAVGWVATEFTQRVTSTVHVSKNGSTSSMGLSGIGCKYFTYKVLYGRVSSIKATMS